MKKRMILTHLRLDFSHLNEHKFRYNFHDIINPMCSCGKEPKTTLHYLLRSDFYSIYRLELLNDVCALNGSLKNSSEEKLLKILLYGAEDFTSQMNFEILKWTIKYIKKTDLSLFLSLTKYLAFNIFLYVFNVFMFNLCTEFTVSSICLL